MTINIIILTMFKKIFIDMPTNIFDKLSSSSQFEFITKSRWGACLADITDNKIPIVRTSTQYTLPIQKFNKVHLSIINKIKLQQSNLEFNNAMIEIYGNEYRKMRYHTDQTLDLSDNGYICIYSCYNDAKCSRKIRIKNKKTQLESEILLEHNSVIIFSTTTNHNNQHKILIHSDSKNKWLGITFRLSKTFITFINNLPYFTKNNKQLCLANSEEKKEFYKHISQEKLNIGYIYPNINYTISPHHLLKPKV